MPYHKVIDCCSTEPCIFSCFGVEYCWKLVPMPISIMSMFYYTHRYQFVILFTFAIMFTGDNKAFLYLILSYLVFAGGGGGGGSPPIPNSSYGAILKWHISKGSTWTRDRKKKHRLKEYYYPCLVSRRICAGSNTRKLQWSPLAFVLWSDSDSPWRLQTHSPLMEKACCSTFWIACGTFSARNTDNTPIARP